MCWRWCWRLRRCRCRRPRARSAATRGRPNAGGPSVGLPTFALDVLLPGVAGKIAFNHAGNSPDAWCDSTDPDHRPLPGSRDKCRMHCVRSKCGLAGLCLWLKMGHDCGVQASHLAKKVYCRSAESWAERRAIRDMLEDCTDPDLAALMSLENPPRGPEPRRL